MTKTAEASYEFCHLCGEITIGDEQHDCTPFRYGDPQMVQLVRITDVLVKMGETLERTLSRMQNISYQLAKLTEIVEHEK